MSEKALGMNIVIKKVALKKDFDKSWYTIVGPPDNFQEFAEGYEKLLQATGLEKPVAWYTCKGQDLNKAFRLKGRQCFEKGINFLFFSTERMNISRLAPFRIRHGDYFLSDLIQNARCNGK